MKTIDEEWQLFVKGCWRRSMGLDKKQQLRRAFLAGALAVKAAVKECMALPDEKGAEALADYLQWLSWESEEILNAMRDGK